MNSLVACVCMFLGVGLFSSCISFKMRGNRHDSRSRTRTATLRRLRSHDGSSVDYDSVRATERRHAIDALKGGNWIKLICGASNQDVSLIRNTCFVFTLAGVNCFDVSCDPAVVLAAHEGMDSAMKRLSKQDSQAKRPILMVSVNDDEDLHFRKATFDPAECPPDCPRPCETICPAYAIPPLQPAGVSTSADSSGSAPDNTDSTTFSDTVSAADGVINERCYGCGRCEPVCPLGLIRTEPYLSDRATISALFAPLDDYTSNSNSRPIHTALDNEKDCGKGGCDWGLVDAIEIHTHGHDSQQQSFRSLWTEVGAHVLESACVVAVSFPDMGERTAAHLNGLDRIIRGESDLGQESDRGIGQGYRAFTERGGVQIWQTDGRPMSGDIGKGTAHRSSEFAAKVQRQLGVGGGESIGV